MQWVYLYIAVMFDIGGTLLLRLSHGFEKMLIGISALLCYLVSFILLAQTLKVVPIGISYAIWSGLGTAIVAVLGIFLFKEQMTLVKAFFVIMIIVGCVGLNLVTKQH